MCKKYVRRNVNIAPVINLRQILSHPPPQVITNLEVAIQSKNQSLFGGQIEKKHANSMSSIDAPRYGHMIQVGG